MSLVQTDVLDTHEIFASGDAGLDSPLQSILLPACPCGVDARAAGVAESDLHDLDPVAGAIVVLDSAGCLRDVDEAWAAEN